MKIMGLMGVMGVMLCGCDDGIQADRAEREHAKQLREAVSARRSAENRVAELEQKNMEYEAEISVLQNRLKIANDSCDTYGKLLDDSNEAKLTRARKLIREASGR